MPQTLLDLNYDVLTAILQHISPHDAAQLALASRAAYRIAFPRFLSDISLGGLHHKPSSSAVSQLKDFCNFVLAPAPCWHGPPTARLDGLRTLEVMRDAVRIRQNGARVVDASAVSLLSSVLERAPNLQRLTLWGSDALFAACPEFGLASSPSIHTLVLGGDIAPLFALAQAFPHIRTLKFIAGGGACVPEWAYASPESDPEALGPWRTTLERVDAGFPIVPLACPVRRVDLRNAIVPDLDSLVTANTFLAATRPVVLSASIGACASANDVGMLLHSAADVRFLDLVGDRCESLRDGYDWMMLSVAEGLARVPRLAVRGIKLSVTPAVVSALSEKSQTNAPDVGADRPIDLTMLARAIADHAPSLEFVAIDLTAAKDASPAERSWFRVVDGTRGCKRRIEKVDEEEGRATLDRMMAFNRYD